MSQVNADTTSPSPRRYRLWMALGGVLIAGLFVWMAVRPRGKVIIPESKGQREDSLGLARAALARETDLTTARTSLQQINTYLGQNPNIGQEFAPAKKEELVPLFGLDAGEAAELEAHTFTLLDGYYLDQCFLLRDAAGSLQIGTQLRGGDGARLRQTPLESAAAGFAWVMRQVRLEDNRGLAPPAFVLRRGSGSSLERALVFLELLRQLGPAEEMQGCLVFCPDKAGGPTRLWACGVFVGGSDEVYLFDPRLGLPLPGPKGKGIATLRQAIASPDVLGQLTMKDGPPYDVTAELAAAGELQQVCPLSALAPRMQFLEKVLQGPTVHVRLTADAGAERVRLEQAATGSLGKKSVTAWRETGGQGELLAGPGLLRRFLPASEGGGDVSEVRMQAFYRELVPWGLLPPYFADEERFPANLSLGQRVRLYFARPFLVAFSDPQMPRNLMLRGRFSTASTQLVQLRDALKARVNERQSARGAELEEEVERFREAVLPLYLAQTRAQNDAGQLADVNRQIDAAWGKAQAVILLLDAANARPRMAEFGYIEAMIKQSEAEQNQSLLTLLDRSGRPPTAADRTGAEGNWEDALGAWTRLKESYPKYAPQAVQPQLARCLLMLGRKEKAKEVLLDPSVELTPLEKISRLIMANGT